ncbi:MAG: DUF4157 domain-containing protein [Deltaproteobacteria bacterium]|nr:DUF4157 domain-containing protein [Deltaproteobacteria bacterium]
MMTGIKKEKKHKGNIKYLKNHNNASGVSHNSRGAYNSCHEMTGIHSMTAAPVLGVNNAGDEGINMQKACATTFSQRNLGNSYMQSVAGNLQTVTRGSGPKIQRKCSCGGSCSACSGGEEFKGIQRKLKIGPANDVYEQEADRVAEQVMRMPESRIQRKACSSYNENKEGEQIQGRPVFGGTATLVQRQLKEKGDVLQPKEATGRTRGVAGDAQRNINHLRRGSGKPLSESERSFFEPRFGADFSRVRIHNNKGAANAAKSISARALTFGHHVAFGAGEYAPGTSAGRKLLAHELTHTLQQSEGSERIQRAETDDNPQHCFPTDGTPLQDSASTINSWIGAARVRSRRDGIHMVNAVYQELASGGSISAVERRLGSLPSTHVNHIDYSRSRYAGTLMWPVDPFTRSALWAAGKIFVAPVINLCGTCVGTDKVGHFFQQGYEYYRLYRSVEARIQAMPEDEQRAFYRRIAGPPIPLPDLPIDFEREEEPFGLGRFEVTPAAIVELAASAFVMQFGRWLEGFNNTLTTEDERWIHGHSFIPFYYHEGVYGASTTGVLSRADLQANRRGFQFYQDLWHNPGSPPDICDYVGGLWNEYTEINSVVPALGSPRGPYSESRDVETP